MMNNRPLRYKITSWEEVGHILSNNDKHLHLESARLLAPSISGIVVRVIHEELGCLFATLINGQGTLLTQDNVMFDALSTEDILHELHKFGFEVQYEPECSLDGDLLAYLMSLYDIGYDRIRILPVYSYNKFQEKQYQYMIVAFDSVRLADWTSNIYECSIDEFSSALQQGYALSVDTGKNAKKYDWTFLQDIEVGFIDKLLDSNS